MLSTAFRPDALIVCQVFAMSDTQRLLIIGHRIVKGVVDYQLRDRVTGQTSFEPSYVLDQTREDLIQYRRQHRLTRFAEHAAPPAGQDPYDPNGVDTPTVLDLIMRYGRRLGCINNGLLPEDYPGPSAVLPNRDHLYVHGYGCHFYVYLFISSRYPRFSIVMDGENFCADQPEVLQDLREVTRRRLRAIRFANQTHRAQCGSSAIAICLALMQRYPTLDYKVDLISVGFRTIYREIKRRLHKFPTSPRSPDRRHLIIAIRHRCRQCNKAYKRYRDYVAHERKCSI